MPIGQGQIVLAEVDDPQGRNRKQRPLVVVTPTVEIREGSPFVGVAISTTILTPVPDDHVELPFHPNGKVRTGLRKRSVAVCTWLQPLNHSDVIRTIGHVPESQLAKILSIVGRHISVEPVPPKLEKNGKTGE
jgi:mRNA-degrading endonuclease toxin of MazEF toxin-antitoxin module